MSRRPGTQQPRPRSLVLLVVAVQVGLPLSLLGVRWVQEGSRPQTEKPASWQMYTSTRPASYTGSDAAGRSRALDVDPLPPLLRAADTGRVVPDRLCARHDDLVVVVREGGPDPGAFPC